MLINILYSRKLYSLKYLLLFLIHMVVELPSIILKNIVYLDASINVVCFPMYLNDHITNHNI